MTQKPACRRCRFFETREVPGSIGPKGQCHRFPPNTVQGRAAPGPNVSDHIARTWRQGPEHYFPLTLADQWCGEFQPFVEEGGDA